MRRKDREILNWRVQRYGRDVVAIEPNRVYETPFDGPDAFWAAVEFAAAELRKDDLADAG